MSKQTMDAAKKNKADEFYTQLSDIELELANYKNFLRNKVIYCCCDDPDRSNFVRYFVENFNDLRLKRLIVSCYSEASVSGTQLSLSGESEGRTYMLEVNKVSKKSGSVADVMRSKQNRRVLLAGDGDFRSPECIEFLRQSDIVVTNPPFSLFREFIAQIVEHGKDFIVIGNTNAIKYKEIFRLIKAGKFRTGFTNFNVGMYFIVPEVYDEYHKEKEWRKLVRVSTSCWFTSLPIQRQRKPLELTQIYTPERYPKYDNHEAIEVSKAIDIPKDWFGPMGVPITFLDKLDPEQFEIIGFRHGHDGKDLTIGGKIPYTRLLIQQKK